MNPDKAPVVQRSTVSLTLGKNLVRHLVKFGFEQDHVNHVFRQHGVTGPGMVHRWEYVDGSRIYTFQPEEKA